MRIVHFTKKLMDSRALRAAFHAQSLGHDVIFVRHAGAVYGQQTRMEAQEAIYGRLPAFSAGGPDGPRLCRMLATLKPDVVHVHELDQLFQLCAVSNKKVVERLILDEVPLAQSGIEFEKPPFPIVFDMHEDEQGLFAALKMDEQARRDRLWSEFNLAPLADAFVCVSPSMKRRFEARHLEHIGKAWTTTVVNNAPPKLLRPLKPDEARAQLGLPIRLPKRRVFFTGYASGERKIPQLIRACKHKGWQLFIMGDLDKVEPEAMAELRSIGTIQINPQQYPWSFMQEELTMLDVLALAEVGYCGARLDVPNWQVGLPNKVFEYGFAGVPVVTSNMPDTRALVETYEIGCAFDNTPRDLIAKLDTARGIGGRASRNGAFETFHAEQNYTVNGGPKMMDVYLEQVAK